MKIRISVFAGIVVLVLPLLWITPASAGSLSLKHDEWAQISPPRDLQGITLRALTRNYLVDSDYGSGWSVFKLLDSGDYQTASLDEPLEQGRGYWIITSGPDVEIPLPHNSQVTPDQSIEACAGSCFGIELLGAETEMGLNLLGYPYEFAQRYGDARIVAESGPCRVGCTPIEAESAGQMFETLFHYDGVDYQSLNSNSMLQPWQAFWAASLDQSNEHPAELIFDNPIQSPLVGYWPLDDGSGLSAHDASRFDSAGVLSQAFWATGRQQGGVCLGGTQGEDISAASGAVDNPSSVSIAAWIKPVAEVEKWGWIGSFGDSAGLYIKRDGTLVMYIWDGNTWPDVQATTAQLRGKLEIGAEGLYDGQWHHVTGSYDPANGFSIHVDGVLIASAAATNAINYSQGGQWRIGSMQGQRNFSGCLDEVRVFGSVLSLAEVETLAGQAESAVPNTNAAPQVALASDQTIVLSDNAVVAVSVVDDGRPLGGVLSARWEQRAGPAVTLPGVTLDAAGNATSVLNFTQTGLYEFELIASDSEKSGSERITITVELGVEPIAGAICISEFQAADQEVIADEDQDYPDWIELYNPGNSAVSLAGWCLTDDADEPGQWCFDSGSIPGKGYQVVFASDKDRQSPNFHTNFKLGKGGEYLGIFNPSGEEVCAFAPEYPQQYDLLSYGTDAAGAGAYFSQPTPGATNQDASVVSPIQIAAVDDVEMQAGENRQLSISISGVPSDSIDFSGSELPEFVELGSYQNGVLTLDIAASATGVFGATIIAANQWFDNSEWFLITVGDPVETQVPPSLCITEFMAADQEVIADENNAYPDWIELHNSADTPLSLAGWCLSDDETDPTGWCFNAGTLGADEYLVVFASGDNQQGPPSHTNFKLSKGGEYLGVFDPSGQAVCQYAPEFPQQYDNVSYGLDSDGGGVYFGQPTPGAANDLTSIDIPFELAAIANISMDVGEQRSVQIQLAGSEPTAVSFDGSALPAFATLIDNGDGTARLSLQPESAGTFDITVSATSGVFTDSVTFTLVATNAGSAIESVDQMQLSWGGKPLVLDAPGNRLFLSLGEQYRAARDMSGVFSYLHSTAGYHVNIDGTSVDSGAVFGASVQHGDRLTLLVTRNAVDVWSFDVVITNLPILQVVAEEIVDEPKLPGVARWADGDRNIDSGLINLGIEYRGVSAQLFDKKPFGLEFREPESEDGQNIQLLGLRNDDDWIADAAYRDQSFARNLVTYDLYREMQPFAYLDQEGVQQGQSTVAGGLSELILNSRYHGVYMMHERVDRKLLSLEKIDVPEDELGERWDLVDFDDPANGSVLYKAQLNQADLTADSAIGFEQKYPDEDDIIYVDALDELIAWVNETPDAEFAATVGDIVNLESLVDYWLITLATANRDALWKNYYLARNQGSKWFFVPWDYDATFGMTYLGGEDDTSDRSFQFDKNYLLVRIGQNPSIGFYDMALARWQELRDTLLSVDAVTARFAGYAEQLDRAAGSAGKSPRERNLDRWPQTGNDGAGQPELGQPSYIREWLVRRMDYVDNKLLELAGE